MNGMLLASPKFVKALLASPAFKRLGLRWVTIQLIKQDRAHAARIWEAR